MYQPWYAIPGRRHLPIAIWISYLTLDELFLLLPFSLGVLAICRNCHSRTRSRIEFFIRPADAQICDKQQPRTKTSDNTAERELPSILNPPTNCTSGRNKTFPRTHRSREAGRARLCYPHLTWRRRWRLLPFFPTTTFINCSDCSTFN